MSIQTLKSPLEIRLIGEAALSVLSATGQGTVLASVTNAVYLQNQHGELCWLIPMDVPMHRRGLRLDAQLPRMKVGSTYQVVDHTLVFNFEETLDFHQSLIWSEPKAVTQVIIPTSMLSEYLHLVTGRLLTQHHPSGLGYLIEPILQVAILHQNTLPASFTSRIAEITWPEVNGIIQSSLGKDEKLFMRHVKSLVGLGEGLTPSGDDFLGGLLFAMRRLQDCNHGTMNLLACIYSDFILQMKPLTNLLSYTILMDHSGGHSVEPLHQLADGL
ncbi:MAG TPA: DUF2877 domain-containing protein, partial [Anaerolineales bacterium]